MAGPQQQKINQPFPVVVPAHRAALRAVLHAIQAAERVWASPPKINPPGRHTCLSPYRQHQAAACSLLPAQKCTSKYDTQFCFNLVFIKHTKQNLSKTNHTIEPFLLDLSLKSYRSQM
ncbi:hypothetical protein QCD60_25960 [Pokkaliibacter sp. MBI-7]|uniref:hypothetical protein n=1 Tax=Pokkaliibacter sp. MBI-7 TaxID=3040600 RepID=UPI00244AD266|nr:hypothetical protein [Pokkaliibacter sp. MBI-7]MDH2435981.1 hypothetical protein [Pokkaliibacter sp. MBI-7]